MPENKFPMPAVILVRPQMGENIGAAARAMFNFGLTDLRLVNPRDGWPSAQAQAMSSGALDKMPPVQVFDTLPAAIADLHYVLATTARARDMLKPVFTPESAAQESLSRARDGQNTGIVFGAERAGLSNDEVAACQSIITIPANPDFSSLNLGQSVLLIACEWMRAARQAPSPASSAPTPDKGGSLPAQQKDIENFLTRLEAELERARFFRTPEVKPFTLRNIRNIFIRADITEQELRTLHGIVSALKGNKSDDRSG